MTCGIKGHERPEKPIPFYRIEMGGNRKTIATKKCPWSVALEDTRTSKWLLAYGLVERWQRWPPGRDDPQLLEAMLVISSEHSRIDAEKNK